MRAVVMAGGEGTRLRPMTTSMPKPLLPVVNRPIMEHVLRLLRRHELTETVVTVHFLGSMVRAYFGDGEDLDMDLTYATEEKPLGTAGSVKNAAAALSDDTFLVISGDALTDIDLTSLVEHHRRTGALATVCLTRVPDPLEFGITILNDDGLVERFLEKPTWGQVFSDTVNTGIYVMEPEILDSVGEAENVDWSSDVFPRLLAKGAPLYGYVADGYWEDVGTHRSYLKANYDALDGQLDIDIDGFEVSAGVWVGEGADVDPEATLKGPTFVGAYAKVEGGAEIRDHTVVGDNVVVRSGAFLHRAVVHDNAYVGGHTNLRGCVVGKNTDVMRGARIEDGAVVGDDCVIEEEAVLHPEIKVYPSKTIEAGAVVNQSVIWESQGRQALFGARGLSGIVNVEITPELVVRLASAYATTLRKGSTVLTARDTSRSARALKRAAIAAFTSSALNVCDLEVAPNPVARLETARSSVGGGLLIRTTPNRPDSVDLIFLDERGADLSAMAQRKVERVLGRQEFRRAFPGEIGDLTFPSRIAESYVRDLLRSVDTSNVAEARLKVVVDAGRGTASQLLPNLLGRLDIDAFLVNAGLDDRRPTETAEQRTAAVANLAELVSSSRAAFGVRFDPLGERISLVDETGNVISDERALLVFVDLVAAESGRGRNVALPVTTTRVAEQVAAFHGVQIRWTTTAPDALATASATEGLLLAGDGRGGFIVPEFSNAVDGFAAFVRLVGVIARTGLRMSEINARIPRAHVVQLAVPTPWASKGAVMRAAVEAADGRELDTTDGVRVVEPDGSWGLVLPDPTEAVTRVWAESTSTEQATTLAHRWADLVTRAGR
ncbi:sugar phosphate nucleotidyltransferase [Actinopolymorpha singaporensis]|uniref:Mannose-1-phosphate guanylyltransferase / phosphomannomutase n=1 Tax=Actinopolymorpha singaporensis TaxID=117157 RepID=A0A1H1WWS7_9ACTN|nr:mannose-1-phosphate guanyltransferase [Actinopolymorpha singaporensis]SDT01617.1 mannose-1-phosphate guanylyltransferase / phosphomannomutase [Actinopolymorpha singaporensis]